MFRLHRCQNIYLMHMRLQDGKLADIVLWAPSHFGSKPEVVIKGGSIAWAQMGDPNGSIPTPRISPNPKYDPP